MSAFVADIKNTFSSAITELKAVMLALNEQVHSAEHMGQKRDKALTRLESVANTHTAQLIAVNRHFEDLDNRGRRHNFRVRGVQEALSPETLKP